MREREYKLEGGDDVELGDVASAIPGATLAEVDQRRLVATYYDADDLRLARWGCTVRERNDSGWVVKLPVPSSGSDAATVRDEVGIDADGRQPPHAAEQLVSALSRWAPLHPIATISTDRAAHVFAVDGAPVVELTDDRVEVVSSAGVERTFRELEVELLVDDSSIDVSGLLEHLEGAGFRPAGAMSKLVRGIGEHAAAPADVEVPEVSKWPTGREVAHAAIAAAVAHLLLHVPHARLGAEVGVHQCRVSIRRLRSDLKTFRDLLDPAWAEHELDELKWLGSLLGQVRDDDVLLGRLNDVPAAAPLVPIYQQQRNTHRSELLRALDGERAAQLLDRLVTAAHDPPATPQADDPAADLLRPMVRKRWKNLRQEASALGKHPADAELHRVRILAKRCRYALEAASPAFGSAAKSRAKALADLQDTLGDLNDLAVISTRLGHTHTFTPEEAFAAGQVVGQFTARAEHDRDAWRAVWRKAADKQQWQWL